MAELVQLPESQKMNEVLLSRPSRGARGHLFPQMGFRCAESVEREARAESRACKKRQRHQTPLPRTYTYMPFVRPAAGVGRQGGLSRKAAVCVVKSISVANYQMLFFIGLSVFMAPTGQQTQAATFFGARTCSQGFAVLPSTGPRLASRVVPA